MRDDETVVEVIGVNKQYGRGADAFTALDNVSLTLQRGRTLVLIGPSGSGKSTLLRCVCNLEDRDGGEVRLSGQKITGQDARKLRGRVGMVFQSFNLFPHLSAQDNVALAQRLVLKRSAAAAKERALELLRLVGLEDRAQHYPAQLSGGQQQRVAIARTLAMDPEVVLFDEPTSALDPETVGDVIDVMKRLSEAGTTMIVATHEMDFALDSADSIAMLEAGRVVEYSDNVPEFFANPEHERTRSFLTRFRRNAA